MKCLINNQQQTTIIKKSKFITYLFKVLDLEEKDKLLAKIKAEYPDASHICYAYIINNQQRYCDDGEPVNTAGKPIFDILLKNDLNYVLAIVVRYFGGIKLGANGLIRAYSSVVKNLLVDNLKDQEVGYYIAIKEDYEKEKLINYLLKDSVIIKKNYTNNIYLEVMVKKEILANLVNISYTIIKEVII